MAESLDGNAKQDQPTIPVSQTDKTKEKIITLDELQVLAIADDISPEKEIFTDKDGRRYRMYEVRNSEGELIEDKDGDHIIKRKYLDNQ